MVQPLLVSISALTLATETVRSILKIDDVVRTSQSTQVAQCKSPVGFLLEEKFQVDLFFSFLAG